MPQFLSSFSLFWPVSSPARRGVKRFYKPPSFVFSPPLLFPFFGFIRIFSSPFFSLARKKHASCGTMESWGCKIVIAAQLAARPPPAQPLKRKRSPLARFRRNSIDTNIVEEEVYLRLIGCIVTFLCQGWEGIVLVEASVFVLIEISPSWEF